MGQKYDPKSHSLCVAFLQRKSTCNVTCGCHGERIAFFQLHFALPVTAFRGSKVEDCRLAIKENHLRAWKRQTAMLVYFTLFSLQSGRKLESVIGVVFYPHPNPSEDFLLAADSK